MIHLDKITQPLLLIGILTFGVMTGSPRQANALIPPTHPEVVKLAPMDDLWSAPPELESVIAPSFWASLIHEVVDYSPWTPDEVAHAFFERSASALGLFSTSHRYRISSRFGWRAHPILKRKRMHNGLDLAAPSGTPVRAVQDGEVTYASRRGAYGNFVEIEHDGKWDTGYAHLNKISVLPHTHVEQGDKIGTVGTTGRSTGPHLHFVVKKWGVPVDPLITKGFTYISPIIPLSYNLLIERRDASRAAEE